MLKASWDLRTATYFKMNAINMKNQNQMVPILSRSVAAAKWSWS